MKYAKQQPKKGFLGRLPSIIGVIICVLLAPILIMNLTIIIKSYIHPERVPDFFGIKPFIVSSPSMEDAIMTGDLVVTKTVDPATLKEGDIISFKSGTGDAVITHRIHEVTEKDGQPVFITMGDNNKGVTDAKPVTYEQVESVYLFKIDRLGRLAMFMQKPVGMMVFVGIPLCSFILYDIIRRRLTDRREAAMENDAQTEIERLKAELDEKMRQAAVDGEDSSFGNPPQAGSSE